MHLTLTDFLRFPPVLFNCLILNKIKLNITWSHNLSESTKMKLYTALRGGLSVISISTSHILFPLSEPGVNKYLISGGGGGKSSVSG